MPGESYLIVGLGNIGSEYADTRHNMGFLVLDAWAQASNIVFETRRYGDLGVTTIKGRTIYLLKPSTYMNLSGNAVRYWLQKLPVPIENLLIICDDINLPFGTLRMRRKGSDGGHNGLKNINEMTGTQDYVRIRIGVGHEFEKGDQIDFVLGQLGEEQKTLIPKLSATIVSGIQEWIFCGIDRAMNSVNAKNQ